MSIISTSRVGLEEIVSLFLYMRENRKKKKKDGLSMILILTENNVTGKERVEGREKKGRKEGRKTLHKVCS